MSPHYTISVLLIDDLQIVETDNGHRGGERSPRSGVRTREIHLFNVMRKFFHIKRLFNGIFSEKVFVLQFL